MRLKAWLLRFLRRYTHPVLWIVTCYHLIIAFTLILLPAKVGFVTGLRIYSADDPGAGLVFLFSAMACLIALVYEVKTDMVNPWTFWAFIPQQMLLMITAGGVVYAIIIGHYASGTRMSAWFIFVDQVPKLLLAVSHPFAMLQMHKSILPPDFIHGDGEDVG